MKSFVVKPGFPGMLFLVALLLIATAAFAQEKDALARVDAFLLATGTLHADFSQVMVDDSGRVLSESEGTMSIKRPGRFRWHYRSPDELLVLGDGKQVWSYDVELENVTVASQADMFAGNPAALLAGNGSAAEAFELVKSWRSGETDWVELIPREKQQDFRHISLGFAGEALVGMELHDQLGQTTRITFSRVLQNAPVDDETFVFTPPEGVDVITAGGLAP